MDKLGGRRGNWGERENNSTAGNNLFYFIKKYFH
jgi:hypothetical protein